LGSVLGWAREAGIDESDARLWLTAAWRPNPDDIKVLSAEKKRLQREWIDILKSQNDEKYI